MGIDSALSEFYMDQKSIAKSCSIPGLNHCLFSKHFGSFMDFSLLYNCYKAFLRYVHTILYQQLQIELLEKKNCLSFIRIKMCHVSSSTLFSNLNDRPWLYFLRPQLFDFYYFYFILQQSPACHHNAQNTISWTTTEVLMKGVTMLMARANGTVTRYYISFFRIRELWSVCISACL